MADGERTRRTFMGALVAGGMGLTALVGKKKKRPLPGLRLRPPGAVQGDAFLDACIRCGKCQNICPNDCIELHGLKAGIENAFTPYIKARSRGCTLCGECADVCPTGALKPFTVSREGWVKDVKMGTARVDKSMCFSFHGRTCGACYRACPIAGEAMTIGIFETPHVHPEACVGCGLCEQACLHLPQAIRVIPRSGSGA